MASTLSVLGAGQPHAAATDPMERTLMRSDGTCLEYTAYAPEAAQRGPFGLLVHLYGSGGSYQRYNLGREPYADLRRILAERGYWIVVPELGGRHWMRQSAAASVDALIAEMIRAEKVDPNRIHLLGTSMGGGSSLVYAMRRPGKIRSVVAIFPMTDFAQWLQEAPGYRSAVEQAHGIASERREEALREISPLQHVDAFRHTPVFLLHGDADKIVPAQHSRNLAAALERKGYPVIYREAAGKSHNDGIAAPYQREIAEFLTNSPVKTK